MSDRADLSNLRDLALPTEVPFWPPAPGWWIVAAVGVASAAILMAMAIARHRRNAYRRQALRELAVVDVRGISALLKRAALVAWPREGVASLTGPAWLAFLDRTGRMTAFADGPAHHLETLAFGGAVGAEDAEAVRKAARDWLRNHRAAKARPS